ncbi:hypothetical protein [Flavobacterium oreochromis]|uniref:Uncharacterized protein n=1 Tax=Flavobacterium columnare TaxID=996 RepID=A0A2D0AHN5_9FLAO|nr:hypothetical protein [Flavobacterium oreochromis]OWP75687.1 hypothetical protein BWK62_11505 [Flavobacterium oreochromis]
MFKLNAKIKVYETYKLIPTPKFYEFNYVKNVEIVSAYNTLTDTAKIEMPKRVFKDSKNFNQSALADVTDFMKKDSIHDYLKLESFIEIYLGYNDEYRAAFRGYITGVSGDNPVIITCEDIMYALKKVKAVDDKETKSSNKDQWNMISPNPAINIQNFNPKTFFEKKINKLKLPIKINALDEDLGNIMINRNQSLAQVFEMLKEKGIHTYFKMEKFKPVLTITNNPQQHTAKEIGGFIDRNFIAHPIAGLLTKKLVNKGLDILGPKLNNINKAFNTDAFLGKARFRFRYNIINDNLTVVREITNNSRIRVEKYFNDSNTPIAVELGDSNGPLLKTYVIHNDDNKNNISETKTPFKEKVAKITAELFQYAALRAMETKPSGLEGTFTTFGEPFVRPTDKVILENAKEKEKNGTFLVKAVKRTFGSNGYRQTIEIGRRVEVN